MLVCITAIHYFAIRKEGLAKKKEKGADCIMVSGVNYCKLSSELSL